MTPTDEERLHAIEEIVVEATMEPFDIGPCYIAGPLPMVKKHAGEFMQVTEDRMLGVFHQLLGRIEKKFPDTIERVNRRVCAVERLERDLAEALALLREGDWRTEPEDVRQRRAALLAKHSEKPCADS